MRVLTAGRNLGVNFVCNCTRFRSPIKLSDKYPMSDALTDSVPECVIIGRFLITADAAEILGTPQVSGPACK